MSVNRSSLPWNSYFYPFTKFSFSATLKAQSFAELGCRGCSRIFHEFQHRKVKLFSSLNVEKLFQQLKRRKPYHGSQLWILMKYSEMMVVKTILKRVPVHQVAPVVDQLVGVQAKVEVVPRHRKRNGRYVLRNFFCAFCAYLHMCK